MKLGRPVALGSTSGGIGGAGEATSGRAKDSRSPETDFSRRFTTTPSTPLSAPAPSATPVSRERRRSVSVSFDRGRVSRRSTTMPSAVPTTVGMTSGRRAPVTDSTAAQPATPATRMARLPTGTRDRSQMAVTAASTPMTRSTITDRNNLSEVPKVWIAHSLAGPGVRLITAVPTAVRESAAGEKNAASNWATPSATATAATPAPIRADTDVPTCVAGIGSTYLRELLATGVSRSSLAWSPG